MDFLDRHRLESLARDLAAAADQLRVLAGGLRGTAVTAHWHSPGSRAFATALETVLASAGSLADRLEGTADAARSHGQRVAALAARAAGTARVAERTLTTVTGRMRPW